MKSDNTSKVMLRLIYVSIFLYAFGYMIYSSLIPSFTDKFKITTVQAGLVGSALSAGELSMLFFSEPISRRIKLPYLIVLSMALHVASVFLIAAVGTFPMLLLAFFMNGSAGSMCNVYMDAYISDTFPEKRGSYLNLFHGIYGIGALAGPILPTWLMRRNTGWEAGYVAVGAVSAVMVLLLIMTARKTPGERAQGPENKTDNFLIRVFRSHALLLICICTFLFMGENMIMGTWMASYMKDQMHAADIAGITLTFYWSGAAIGRICYSLLFARFPVKRFLTVTNAACALAILSGLFVPAAWYMFAVITAVGFLSGTDFPLEIALACESMPDHAISATNAVCFFGSAGGIVFPLLAGWLIENVGYRSILLLIALLLLLIALAGYMLIRSDKQAAKKGEIS